MLRCRRMPGTAPWARAQRSSRSSTCRRPSFRTSANGCPLPLRVGAKMAIQRCCGTLQLGHSCRQWARVRGSWRQRRVCTGRRQSRWRAAPRGLWMSSCCPASWPWTVRCAGPRGWNSREVAASAMGRRLACAHPRGARHSQLRPRNYPARGLQSSLPAPRVVRATLPTRCWQRHVGRSGATRGGSFAVGVWGRAGRRTLTGVPV
mmetsp:Transcript_79802/g.237712  ORF Transcript_79802/g.237712 Transcript_79802/m.237712 type:complete len:205 (-) Transcript_79802:39-653(-)